MKAWLRKDRCVIGAVPEVAGTNTIKLSALASASTLPLEQY